MGFHAITAAYQEQINEHAKRSVSDEMIEEVHDILEEYCSTIEERYGINMMFDIKVSEDKKKISYQVTPHSDLDNTLLSRLVENEACISKVCFTLQ